MEEVQITAKQLDRLFGSLPNPEDHEVWHVPVPIGWDMQRVTFTRVKCGVLHAMTDCLVYGSLIKKVHQSKQVYGWRLETKIAIIPEMSEEVYVHPRV